VLREVVRLERRPWDPGRFDQAVQADPNEGLRRRLATELADAKAELQDNARVCGGGRLQPRGDGRLPRRGPTD
jgi:hypothetical protein